MANTVSGSTTLDVNTIVPGLDGFTGGVQGSAHFPPGFSVVVAEGDTFDFKVDFAGSQTLTLHHVSMLWLFSFANAISTVNATGTLTLLDTAGAALCTSNVKTDDEGSAHLAQFFFRGDLPGLPASVTFGGLRSVGTVNDYDAPGLTERTYADPAFYFLADPFAANVPEPST